MKLEDLIHTTVDDLVNEGKVACRVGYFKRRRCYTLYDLILLYTNYKQTPNVFKKFSAIGDTAAKALVEFCSEIVDSLEIEPEKKYHFDCNIIQIIRELSFAERKALKTLAELVVNERKLMMENTLKYREICSSDTYVLAFYERHGHLPMFRILEWLIRKDESKRVKILKDYFKIFNESQQLSIKQIEKKISLCNTMVIKYIKSINYIFKASNFERYNINEKKAIRICDALDVKDWGYMFEEIQDADIINSKSSVIRRILDEEQSTFTIEIVFLILGSLFRDVFTFFGKLHKNAANKDTNTFDWKNSYLIKTEYSDIFYFEKFLFYCSYVVMQNEIEYEMDTIDIVKKSVFWRYYDLNEVENIASIAKELLLNEFDLNVTNEGKILIPALKPRNPSDVLYEIIKKNNKPMSFKDIAQEFRKILPNHPSNNDIQLKYLLNKHEEIAKRQHQSEYFLSEWEHIYAGTIRDAIFEYLTKKKLPQTLPSIMEHVLKYFPNTNSKSIRTSMLSDTKKRFCVINQNLLGLTNKKYPRGYTKISEYF